MRKPLALIAVCLAFQLVLLTDLNAQGVRPELILQMGHDVYVANVAFSPNGELLASSDTSAVKLWHVATGRQLRTFRAYGGAFEFSPDGQTIAFKGSETTVELWDVTTGTKVRSFAGVDSFAFSPDGKRLATSNGKLDKALGDNINQVWNVLTGKSVLVLEGADSFSFMQFSDDGKILLGTRWATPKVTLWDAFTGKQKGKLAELPLTPNTQKTFTAGSRQYSLSTLTLTVENDLYTFKSHSRIGGEIALSPDSKTLAYREENTVKLQDVITGEDLTLAGHSPPIYGFAVSPDSNTVATGDGGGAAQAEGRFTLWDLKNPWNVRTGGHGWFTSLAFSPDGKILAIGNNQWYGDIVLLDVSTGIQVGRYQTQNPSSGYTLTFSPDGRMLAAGTMHKTVRLLDVSTLTDIRTLEGHSDQIQSVVFSSDRRTIAGLGWDGEIKLWDISTGSQLQTLRLEKSEFRNSIAFTPDGKMLVGGHIGNLKVWDISTGKLVRTLNAPGQQIVFGIHGEILESRGRKGANLRRSSTGETFGKVAAWDIVSDLKTDYLISQYEDSGLTVWDARSGERLVRLIPFDGVGWLAVTDDGLFDGAPTAWSKVLWRFSNNTFDYAPVEAFFNEFYYPGLMAEILAGKRPKAPSNISQKDRRQPLLKLSLGGSKADKHLIERAITLKIDVSQAAAGKNHKGGGGAQDVRLFRNGSLVKVWRGDVLKGKSSVTLEATVPIVAGENKLTAYAFNHDNIKSSDATLVVNGAESLKRQGTAYVLAVGVNQYANQKYNLKYAVADAEDFAAEVKRQQESLKRYPRVEVISLADEQATKANITQRLADLAKQVQPEDAVIIFFAGHGTAQGNQFYLIPHDLGYDGPRENLSAVGLKTILAHSISDRELEKLFEGIDAGQLLLVIDACNSGQALEAEEKRRGPMNSKGLAQLAYEKGMYVMTASQSYQAALEAERFGHGFLTYALVEEGLKKGAADHEPKNGTIDIREWLNFATAEVPRMQESNSREALRSRNRYVVFVGDGRAAGIPKTEAGTRDNIQRPRVFYRRELEANPFVVATVGTTSPR